MPLSKRTHIVWYVLAEFLSIKKDVQKYILFLQISRAPDNQEANELDTYIDVYTQLLSEKIGRS